MVLALAASLLQLAPNLQVTGFVLQVLDVLADHKYKGGLLWLAHLVWKRSILHSLCTASLHCH